MSSLRSASLAERRRFFASSATIDNTNTHCCCLSNPTAIARSRFQGPLTSPDSREAEKERENDGRDRGRERVGGREV